MSRRARRLAVSAVAIAAAWAALAALVPQPLLVNRAGMSQEVLARDGTLLRLSLAGDDALRLWTPLAEIPPAMIEATLLQEDRWFRWHPGVNPVALARAAWRTYVAGDRRQGGSTLTMQLARVRFDLHTRTPRGKLAQIARALQLELAYSKDELLEAYLDLAPYGGNVEGVGAAARVWFGKPAGALSVEEALALAVIPKSPAARAPYTESGRAEIARAAAALAARWTRAHGAVDDRALAALRFRDRRALPRGAPHLADRLLAAHRGRARLATTLDPALQRLVERQVAAFRERGAPWGLRNAAVLLVDHRTMEVLAYVGSADASDASIDGAVDGVRARRSPGSALKPFLYGLALDAGRIHPETMLEDSSLTISAWNPENFDRDFLGPISATEALVRSRNLPAVQLANQLPAPGLHGFLRRAGIGGLRAPEWYGLAIALGGVEVRLDELVRLYAMLANGGRARPLVFLRDETEAAPHAVARAASSAGPPGAATGAVDAPLLSPEASALVLAMLRANPRPGDEPAAAGTRRRAAIAWKTGTSFGFRDAWAAGVFGRFALGVWVGRFDGRGNPAFVGREAAGPLFFAIADALGAAGESLAPPAPPHPPSLVPAEVCALSGAAPGAYCPGRKTTTLIPGRSPIATCTVHRAIAVDVATGLRACPGRSGPGVRSEVVEFWPSHLLALFARAGLARRTPPPFEPGCGAPPAAGLALRIESPQAHVVYALRDGAADEIPFSAVADADGRRVTWFLDGAVVGRSEPGVPLFWPARPGRFTLRAVDELGRAATQPLVVTLLP